jgi:hypothetical protein
MFLIVTMMTIALVLNYKKNELVKENRNVDLLYFGVLLVVLPPLPIVLSVGFSQAFEWGDGYIQVWLGQIGISIIVSSLIIKLVQRYSGTRGKLAVVTTLSFILGVCFLGSFLVNTNVLQNNPYPINNNKVHGWAREVGQRALRAGLLGAQQSPVDIYALPARQWLNADTFRILSGLGPNQLQNPWPIWGQYPPIEPTGCLFKELTVEVETRNYVCNESNRFFFVQATSFDTGFALVATVSKFMVPQLEEWTETISFRAEFSSGMIFLTTDLRRCKYIKGTTLNQDKVVASLLTKKTRYLYSFNFSSDVDFRTLQFSKCD